MELEKVLAEYDAMFGNVELDRIEAFLVNNIEQAKAANDYGAMVTILNEMIGFCRDTTQRDKALNYCAMLMDLMNQMGLKGRVEYATSLLNIANAYRAFGLWKESLGLYEEVCENYKMHVEPNSFSFASLYNNWSLVYQEMEEYTKAKEMLMRALLIVDMYEDAVIPQATTRTNLATTLLQLHTEDDYEAALVYLQEALRIFEQDGGKDFHYGAALVAMGDAHFTKQEYDVAMEYYKKGMSEIEKHVGKTDNYCRVFEKYQFSKKQIKTETTLDSHKQMGENDKTQPDEDNAKVWKNNMENSRLFYEQFGKAMIHEKFPEYEKRIAVGLVGEGSDCFGYDDLISMDHDYEVGFCMWLTDEDYKEIGLELQKQYEQLINQYTTNSGHNLFLNRRRGVFTMNQFCNGILGLDLDCEKDYHMDYLAVREEQLATLLNGEVFRDDLGVFTAVRERLRTYYPDDIWRLRLVQSLHQFSQYAQSNYPRMMARKDYVTANLCIGKAVESTMDIVYLLNRTYAPYYKWKKKGLGQLDKLQSVIPILEELALVPSQKEAWNNKTYSSAEVNDADRCVCLFDLIANLILQELQNQDLVNGNNAFLEIYCEEIIKGKNMDKIERIVDLEWKQFDKVENEGGRASCQDDFETFSIMRKSQYLTWTEEMLISYYNDLVDADNKGWNLIMEKYARMMKTTAPEKYAELEPQLPVLKEERIAIQEEIIKIQVAWMEAFAKKYPKMTGNARSIHTIEDNEYNTSYETYLRGEISTYSENTFVLYGRFIAMLMQNNRNLAYETMNHTAKLYGYDSVEDAEGKM